MVRVLFSQKEACMKRKRIQVIKMLMAVGMVSAVISACGGQQTDKKADMTSAGMESPDAGNPSAQSGNADAETQSASSASKSEMVQASETALASEPTPVSEAASALNFAVTNIQTSEDDLLPQASPETSAMTLFTYDGKTVHSSVIYDSETEQKILDAFASVRAEKVENWTLEDAEYPFYGIEIGREDGWSILAAWSNGYWIAQDGAVYRFDFDFERLKTQGPWEDERELPSFTSFPCARLFTQKDGGWNTRFLVPAAPLNPPDGISMTLDAWEGSDAVMLIANESGEDWSFGEFFEVQVLLDGTWYEIPTVPGNWGFGCLGYYLPAGQSQNMTHHMAMYGELPPGTYRIVLNGLSTEYKIP